MRDHDQPTRHASSEAGFSLLEIMIAVMILALMGGLVATNVIPQFWKAKRDKAQVECDAIAQAVKMYQLQSKSGKLPDAGEFPQCILEPDANGHSLLDTSVLRDGKLVDPWDNPYEYRKDGNSFEIISYGADCSPGGEGDNADISSKRTAEGSGGSGGGSGRRPR